MKIKIFILMMLPVLCMAQGVKAPFGTSNPANSNWSKANIYLDQRLFIPAYAGGDTMVLVILPDGSTVSIPKTSFSGTTPDLNTVVAAGSDVTAQAIAMRYPGGYEVDLSGYGIDFNKSGYTSRLREPISLTGNVEVSVPDHDGTLATLDDIAAQNLQQTLDNGNGSTDSFYLTGTGFFDGKTVFKNSDIYSYNGFNGLRFFKISPNDIMIGDGALANGRGHIRHSYDNIEHYDTIRRSGKIAVLADIVDSMNVMSLQRVLQRGATSTIPATWSLSGGTCTIDGQTFESAIGNTKMQVFNDRFRYAYDITSGFRTQILFQTPTMSADVTFRNKPGSVALTNDFGKGTATLSSGTVTVSDANITSTSCVTATCRTPSGTLGGILKATVSAGSGFTITSISTAGTTVTTDNSTIQYTIIY